METLEQLKKRHAAERASLEKRLAEEAARPVPRIELIRFKGLNGAFAQQKQEMWKCEIVNAAGEREEGGSWGNEGYGYIERKYAKEDVDKWHRRTGWPICEVDNC